MKQVTVVKTRSSILIMCHMGLLGSHYIRSLRTGNWGSNILLLLLITYLYDVVAFWATWHTTMDHSLNNQNLPSLFPDSTFSSLELDTIENTKFMLVVFSRDYLLPIAEDSDGSFLFLRGDCWGEWHGEPSSSSVNFKTQHCICEPTVPCSKLYKFSLWYKCLQLLVSCTHF